MAAATEYPYDKTPAADVSAVDLGADANGEYVLEDELEDEFGNPIAPVQDGKMIYADMVNRLLETAEGADRMTPSLRVTIAFDAGDPIVSHFRSKRRTLGTEHITFVDNGDGNTTVRVKADKLPPYRGEPGAVLHEGTDPSLSVAHYAATDAGIDYRGATVATFDGGVATDMLVTVDIW